jgi:alkyl hydroperoxide reductase subunit AhpC
MWDESLSADRPAAVIAGHDRRPARQGHRLQNVPGGRSPSPSATKIIGLSVDPVSSHEKWAADIEETQGAAPNYPIIGDADFNVSMLYGMLPASTSGNPLERTPADNQTVRNVFVIGPDKKIKLVLVYPMTTGRNFDEVLRVIDSLQLTATHKVSTPVNWQPGDDVIIAGSVSDDAARQAYPEGWKAPRPYIRIVPQPH